MFEPARKRGFRCHTDDFSSTEQVARLEEREIENVFRTRRREKHRQRGPDETGTRDGTEKRSRGGKNVSLCLRYLVIYISVLNVVEKQR